MPRYLHSIGLRSRRRVWLVAAALCLVAAPAFSDDFPSKPIRIVVGFPPGQSTDNNARKVAAKMSAILKQPVFVENKPGATGSIAVDAVKAAPPDGYTLLLSSVATLAIYPEVNRQVRYDVLRDFAPIGGIAAAPLALFTHPDMPVNNVKDMIGYVKAHAGQVSYGSPGNGTSGQVTMEMLKLAAHMDIQHVPYKGSPPMLIDVMGGRIDFAFEPTASIIPQAEKGKLKILGVTSASRLPSLPNVPTIAEQGYPGFEAFAWTGMLAPKGTPPQVVNKLNAALQIALKDPEVVEFFASTGGTAIPGSAADFQRFLAAEIDRWGKVVRTAHITED